MAYRCNPKEDTLVLPYRGGGQGAQYGERNSDSALLVDATRKRLMPPLALPKKEFMEEALGIWNELGLPTVKVPSPWHGYELGNWGDDWTQFAKNAVEGNWEANGLQTLARQRSGLGAETAVRSVEKKT
jgi:4-hydroxy-3-polyprenylbenzoate decarboxylase